MKTIKIGRKLGILLAMILVGGIGIVWAVETAAIDNTTPWTTTASSGTVDETDYGKVDLNGPYAALKLGTLTSGTLDIRYNIVAIPGLQIGQGPMMKVRFKDTGTNSRVLVKLVRYNFNTGANTLLWYFDSNNYVPSTSYQTKSISQCSWPWSYDFYNNAYYIETSITKSALDMTGMPGLASVQLGGTIC